MSSSNATIMNGKHTFITVQIARKERARKWHKTNAEKIGEVASTCVHIHSVRCCHTKKVN